MSNIEPPFSSGLPLEEFKKLLTKQHVSKLEQGAKIADGLLVRIRLLQRFQPLSQSESEDVARLEIEVAALMDELRMRWN